jgi:hypothetical protein
LSVEIYLRGQNISIADDMNEAFIKFQFHFIMLACRFWILLSLTTVVSAFHSHIERSSIHNSDVIFRYSKTFSFFMVPRYDKSSKRWYPSGPEEGPEASYGPWVTLLRQGPTPFFTRVFQPDDYEQAVLKFMAGDKVDRTEAQGNMDAYLRNPSDWQYNRVKGYKVNYSSPIQISQILLTLIWSIVVLGLIGRGLYCLESGDNFWTIFGLTSKVAECVQYETCIFDVED